MTKQIAAPLWSVVVALLVLLAGIFIVVALLLRAGSTGNATSAEFEPWPNPLRTAYFRDCGPAEDCKCVYEQLQLRIPADEAVASFTSSGLEKFLLRDYRSDYLEIVRICLDL